jgi:two-component system response regulator MprA
MEFADEITSPANAVAGEPLTVLIIDDDPPVVNALSELLQDEGYKVAAAGDGRAALDQLRRGLRPCVILLDLMMPGMDGWDFRYEQMKDGELREIPVIVVTATGFSEASLRAQLGDIDVVPKPPSSQDLLAAIQRRSGEPIQ